MRTTPLDHWREHAETFDTNLRNTVETILAVKMTEPVRKQASLTPRLGGLGFRRAVDHADLAFHASWHEALAISKEHWDRPDGVPETYTSQSDASLKFDEAVHTSRGSSEKLNASSAAPNHILVASSLRCPPATTERTPS